jgi:hypothetical protein
MRFQADSFLFLPWVVIRRPAVHWRFVTLAHETAACTVLDPELLAFVRNSSPSRWALELLLLMRRAAPGYLTRDELVQHLRATPTLIDRLLDQLTAARLVSKNDSGAFRFECGAPELEALCDALGTAADQRPIALRDAIISMPREKLRDFSEAFRFKGKDE